MLAWRVICPSKLAYYVVDCQILYQTSELCDDFESYRLLLGLLTTLSAMQRFLLIHECAIHMKNSCFGIQLKNMYLQGPHYSRLCILKPCCTSFSDLKFWDKFIGHMQSLQILTPKLKYIHQNMCDKKRKNIANNDFRKVILRHRIFCFWDLLTFSEVILRHNV